MKEVDSCKEKKYSNEKYNSDYIIGEKELEKLATFFKIFGDVNRLRILQILLSKKVCVCDLAATLDMSQSAVSHQLRLLKQSDLVRFRKDGKSVIYSIADDHISRILEIGLEHIREKKF